MTKLNNHDFYTLWGEALAATDRETFVSDWALSSVWGEPTDISEDSLLEIAAYVGKVYDVAHMSMRDIVNASGLAQTAFAQKFCIPLRTVQDWVGERRDCHDYTRLMMAQLLGLIER